MRRRGREGATVLDAEAGRVLLAHEWPGNLAELKAALEYASLRAGAEGESAIAPHHLPVALGKAAQGTNAESMNRWDLDYREAQAQVTLVDDAIREFATTNRTKLAGLLHVPTPTTLTRRIERSLEKYPELAHAFPRTAESFGKSVLPQT
jgi:transcriptional regulator with PAS, ATPase and Fis domain